MDSSVHARYLTCRFVIGHLVVDFIDSEYAGNLDKRRSLTGYVFTLGGSVVS